jgi:hypothetical protein
MSRDSSAGKTEEPQGGITATGKRKNFWFHDDEIEALRAAAYKQRRPEAEIVREALRRYLGIED